MGSFKTSLIFSRCRESLTTQRSILLKDFNISQCLKFCADLSPLDKPEHLAYSPVLSLTYPCSWLFYFNQAHLHHLCILSPWLLFMLFYPFGNDIHHVHSANKIKLSLPRPTFPRVLPLILSSLPTQAVPLGFRHIDLAQLTSNIVDNRYYLLLILRSAWSLICHSKKLLVYHGRPERKRQIACCCTKGF